MKYFLRPYFKFILLFLITFILTACGPIYQTNYSYVPPKDFRGRQCINNCLEDKSMCNLHCSRVYQRCRSDAQAVAFPQYKQYVREQRRLHKPVIQTVDDFADYSACTSDCGCDNTYRQCYSNCGGKVIAKQVCIAFCKQPKKK